jgi:hypothetical protein
MRRLLMVAGLVALLAAPARAGTNTVAFSGTATIDPGIPCPIAGCALEATATAVFSGQDATGTAACTFSGRDDTPGGATLQHGQGSGTVNCFGGVSVSGTVSFDRTANVVRVSGSVTVNGRSCTVNVTAVFTGGPPPTTSGSFQGGGTVTC